MSPIGGRRSFDGIIKYVLYNRGLNVCRADHKPLFRTLEPLEFIHCIENAFSGGYEILFRQAGIHGLLVQRRRKKPAVASNGCIEEPSGLDIEHHPCQSGRASVILQRLQSP